MEAGEWTHPDISVPQLLSFVQSFVEMLLLASGFQHSGFPAFWRPQEVSRALRWASLLEQIFKDINHKGGKDATECLNRALQTLMLEGFYPEGLPKLSCEVLEEAKSLLFYAISHALGSGNGQVESLVAAAGKDEKDQAVILEQIKQRVVLADSTKSIMKALDLLPPVITRSNHTRCECQQWRQKAVSYLWKGTTLYKVSGAAALFKCTTTQWKPALQRIQNGSSVNKLADIVELCCLYLSMHRQPLLIARLLEPCDKMSCSTETLKKWDLQTCMMAGGTLKEMDAVATFLQGLIQNHKTIWWSLPPILVAAAISKRSILMEQYSAQLSGSVDADNEAQLNIKRSERCSVHVPDINLSQRDERKWSVWFVQSIAEND